MKHLFKTYSEESIALSDMDKMSEHGWEVVSFLYNVKVYHEPTFAKFETYKVLFRAKNA